MLNSRGVWVLGLTIFMFSSMVLGGDLNKSVPMNKSELSDYSGKQIFDVALQAYACSFLMTLAGQMEKGQFLRGFSVKLMQQEKVKEYGKNWNDVNFPGALSATTMSRRYSKKFYVSESVAAFRILSDDPQCKVLNKLTIQALKDRS